ncbi:MAG TPA: GNAT family N-acetyltransferase [Alphaproteobacteria bacterium]|jgi:predicted GNAT family acetyltransferase|nr:GNAT family N-acetyltransferase [Alphaproteobacteria bacterium]
MADDVRDNEALHRYELEAEGETALAYYRREPGVIIFTHVEVPYAVSGRGIGSRLVRGALDRARAEGLKVVPRCPFVAAYMARHREYDDLVL